MKDRKIGKMASIFSALVILIMCIIYIFSPWWWRLITFVSSVKIVNASGAPMEMVVISLESQWFTSRHIKRSYRSIPSSQYVIIESRSADLLFETIEMTMGGKRYKWGVTGISGPGEIYVIEVKSPDEIYEYYGSDDSTLNDIKFRARLWETPP